MCSRCLARGWAASRCCPSAAAAGSEFGLGAAVPEVAPEHPLLLSGAMVRAVMRGIANPGSGKTQIRGFLEPLVVSRQDFQSHDGGRTWARPIAWDSVQPGHGLWVKETWTTDAGGERIYAADPAEDGGFKGDRIWGWKDGRFMPRHASRFVLTVSDVRHQRLQDITDRDAAAEGLEFSDGRWGVTAIAIAWEPTPREAFRALWNHQHGERPWDDNPLVVVVTFTGRVTEGAAECQTH